MENIYLRVFSDNTRAINLYNNIGFNEILRIPLLKKEVNGHNHWVPLLDSVYTEVNRYFVTMKLDNDN